jgi:hypothetical protein
MRPTWESVPMPLSRFLIIVGLLFCAGCEKRAGPIAQVVNGTSATEIPAGERRAEAAGGRRIFPSATILEQPARF